MSISWPFLSDNEIEDKASNFREQALQALGLETAVEVPIEQIAEIYLEYTLEFAESVDNYPTDVIGGIDFNSRVIIINESVESHIGRYSFTIAHEIAHHVLHREIYLNAQTDDSIMCRGGTSRPIEEVQADRFAEALLMPRAVVEDSFKNVMSGKLFKVANRHVIAANVVRDSGLGNVSVSAMSMRLNHLGLMPSGRKTPYFKAILAPFRAIHRQFIKR